jgi:hypothetical protein
MKLKLKKKKKKIGLRASGWPSQSKEATSVADVEIMYFAFSRFVICFFFGMRARNLAWGVI